MPKPPSSRSQLLNKWIKEVDNEVYQTDGKVVLCMACNEKVNSDFLTNLKQHDSRKKHQTNLQILSRAEA